MPVSLYTDHHVERAIVAELRRRRVDVLTTVEDGTGRTNDPMLLDRATSLGRVLVTYDRDLLVEVQRRQSLGIPFAGIVYGRPIRVSIGARIGDLELIAKAGNPEDFQGQVTYLPI